MEKFGIVAKDDEKGREVRELAESIGFTCSKNPDFIITVGGDGTFLMAERESPGIAKLLIRDSMVCFKCHDEPADEVLRKIKEGNFELGEMMKLEAEFAGEKRIAANDVIIRNADPGRAIRFKVRVDGKDSDIMIGDGVVISTPFGSTGYFYSITKESFPDGMGIAFNNTTKHEGHRIVSEDSQIEVQIVRGEAQVTTDNHPDIKVLGDGDVIMVRKHGEPMQLISPRHE